MLALVLTAALLGASPIRPLDPLPRRPIVDLPTAQWRREPFLVGQDGARLDLRDIAVDRQGRIWAIGPGGAWCWSPGSRPDWQRHPHHLAIGPAYAVERVSSGQVLLGTWRGLYRSASDEQAAPAEPALQQLSEVSGPVTAIAASGDQALAAGPGGIWQVENGAPRHWPVTWPTPVRALAQWGDTLWVGTPVGLFRVAEGKTTRCDGSANSLALPSASVTGLELLPEPSAAGDQARARLLVSALGGWGDWLLTQREPPVRLSRAEPLASPLVEGCRRQPGQAVWLATAQGLIRLSEPTTPAAATTADPTAGPLLFHSLRWLPSDDVRAVYGTADGKIYVATAAGASVLLAQPMTLAEKATHYGAIAQARHVRPPGLVEKCRLAQPGDLKQPHPEDTDNDGQYTAQYLAAESFRYAVTADPAARANARRALDAVLFLQTVTGTRGFFARTVVPSDWTEVDDANRTYSPSEQAHEEAQDPRWKRVDVRWRPSADGRWLWKGDTSSDEVTGHYFAYPIYYDLVADETERARLRDHVRRVTDHIIDGGYVLRDTDGEPTRWGVWSPEKLNHDPNWQLDRGVNSVEILAYLQVAEHLTGDPKYDAAAQDLLTNHDYATNILSPQTTDPATFTFIDTQLLAMAYHALLPYETDPARRRLYQQSLAEWLARDPLDGQFGLVWLVGAALSDDPARRDATPYGAWFHQHPLDLVQWSIDNRPREDVALVRRPYGDRLQTARLLDPRERALAKWDSNPLAAVAGEGGLTESPGTLWLLPYWMGRFYGLVSAPPDEARAPEQPLKNSPRLRHRRDARTE